MLEAGIISKNIQKANALDNFRLNLPDYSSLRPVLQKSSQTAVDQAWSVTYRAQPTYWSPRFRWISRSRWDASTQFYIKHSLLEILKHSVKGRQFALEPHRAPDEGLYYWLLAMQFSGWTPANHDIRWLSTEHEKMLLLYSTEVELKTLQGWSYPRLFGNSLPNQCIKAIAFQNFRNYVIRLDPIWYSTRIARLLNNGKQGQWEERFVELFSYKE